MSTMKRITNPIDDLKVKYDPNRSHHYFIGVARYPQTAAKRAGKMFLKYGPVYFRNEDINKYRDALIRYSDQVFKQTLEEALKLEGVYELSTTLATMKLSCIANECTMHHFSSSTKFGESELASFIELCNTDEKSKKLLEEAKV